MDTPDLDQLGRIASTVKRNHWPDGSMPCGITHEDLIAEGFLAYVQAKQFKWSRARFAMIDYIRSAVTPVSASSLYRARDAIAVDLKEDLIQPSPDVYRPPVKRMGLKRGDIHALRTFCYRLLSEKKATIMIGTLIEGETIEVIADRMGIPRSRAVMMRSQAMGEIRNHLNN